MKSKLFIIPATTTNISIPVSQFSSSFVLILSLFLTTFLLFTTTTEIAIFTGIGQEVLAFKPTIPSEQTEDQQEQEEKIQQVGKNITEGNKSLAETIGKGLEDLAGGFY